MASGDDFAQIEDEAFGDLAKAAPLRVPRKGKADIGGRMRVASILRTAGVGNDAAPERIAGSTNEVWKSGPYVIRVGFMPGATRLRREAELAKILPREVHYPPVVASGAEAFGEWIIVRHRVGRVLSREWSGLSVEGRRDVTHDIAHALHAVHDLVPSEEGVEKFSFREELGELAPPHDLRLPQLRKHLDCLKDAPYVDFGIIKEAEERLDSLVDAFFEHERHGIVHGDLHFENVMALDGVLVALLDFEWARVGSREIDIDVLARFCSEPELHVGGEYQTSAMDYRDVLRWVNEVYPELFDHEFIHERLMYTALAFEIPSLAALPPDAPAQNLVSHHPINRLKRLLNEGTHAERLGWTV